MSVGWQCGRKVLLIFLNCVKPPIQVSGVELRIVTKQKSQYNNTTHYNCHLIQFKYICHRSFSSIACFVNETVRTILQQSRSHLAVQYTEPCAVYITVYITPGSAVYSESCASALFKRRRRIGSAQ